MSASPILQKLANIGEMLAEVALTDTAAVAEVNGVLEAAIPLPLKLATPLIEEGLSLLESALLKWAQSKVAAQAAVPPKAP